MRKTRAKHAGKIRSRATPTKLKRPAIARSAARKATSQRVTRSQVVAPVTADKKNRSDDPRSNTKQARIIAMLRAPVGATVDAIAATMGWQQHSVRGFLAGVIRKKLALNLISERGIKGRVYRVVEGSKPEAALAAGVRPVA